MLMNRLATCFSLAALAALLPLLPSTGNGQEPPQRQRSFRPIVPIKQSIRGGFDQMKSQTVKLTIPPPPIEESPSTALTPAEDTLSTVTTTEAAKADLPPAPAPATEAAEENSVGSDTPPSSKTEKKEGVKGPTLTQLRNEAHALAGKKLSYVFGASNPDTGGLDCSSTIQYLLTKIGVEGVPRTSYDQYYWLKRKNLLDDVYGNSPSKKLLKKLSPGDLIFWGGTWKSGHRVSHVMLYMGYDPATDKHYVFGARSKNTTGLTGAGVDIFELDTERGRLVAHGKIPGLIYD